MAFVRDLAVRFRAEDAGLIPALETANREVEEIAGGLARASQEMTSFQQNLRSGAGTFSQLTEYARGWYSQLQPYRQVLDALGMAGVGFMTMAGRAAAQAEWALVRAQSLLGKGFPAVLEALEREQRRFRGAVNISDWLEDMAPVLLVLGENADMAASAIGRITERIIAMGGDAGARARVWLYIAQAISTGSAEMLTRASRYLPFPLIQGEEALRIARRMRREYSDTTNAMILFQAIAKSSALDQKLLNEIMDTAVFRSMRLGAAFRELQEQMGKGWARSTSQIQDALANLFQWITQKGAAGPLGGWLSWFSMLLLALGGGKFLLTILTRLGLLPATLAGAGLIGLLKYLVVGLGPWLLGIAALAMVIQDLLSADSVIKKMARDLAAAGAKAVDALTEWARSLFGVQKVTEATAQAMLNANQAMKPYTVVLEKEGISPMEIAKEARTGEEAWEMIRGLGAYRLVQRIREAFAISMPKELEKMGVYGGPAQAAAILGVEYEQYMEKWARGEMTVADMLREAIRRFETGQYTKGLEFQALELMQAQGLLQELKRALGLEPPVAAQILEQAQAAAQSPAALGGGTVPVGTVTAFTPRGEKVEVTVNVEQGAVQLTLGGDYARVLAPEVTEQIIKETLSAIEVQLRSVLNEESHPGMR